MAPAFCAFRIFSENVQVPREIRAILPVRLPAGDAAQASLRPLHGSRDDAQRRGDGRR